MKFKIEVDLTPQEFREAVGLPDVAKIQEEVIESVRKKMVDGVEGFDTASMFKSLMSQGMVTATEMQKVAEKFMNLGSPKQK